MNNVITRLRRGSRTALAAGVATIVVAPLGASVGLGLVGSPAGAAVPDLPAVGMSGTIEKKGDEDTYASKPADPDLESPLSSSMPLSESVPWTAEKEEAAAAAADVESFDALVFSKTQAFRHANIPTAITAIQKLGVDNGFNVTTTEDAGAFTDANLEQYEVVIFLSTTGDVLNETQQGAFERYIKAGGGYAGIHAASDTEYSWPWYGNLVGSYFNNHPNGTPTATVKVEDPAHPSTAGIEPRWERTDEWYNFRTNPRGKVHVLASMDETTYAPGGGAMGAEHPIAWCQDYDGGRSWYTGMGHTDASFQDSKFLGHILGGIRTAAGVVPSDCAATLEPSFEKVALDENTSNPMELAIAEDGRVFYIDRNGAVKIIKEDGSVVTAATVPVYTGQEFGLLGIALDPNFATNNWVYLYYAPQGTASIDRISRFTMSGDTMPLNTAVTILDVDVQRNECCHAGGSMEFDNDGNLYLATGDNSNPFASDGYTPIDERSGRSAWDAQRTSGNTNSLSGKVLKIKPKAEGGYTIPAGNLFDEAQDAAGKTRPEIYAMGFRNPFRIGLDEQNNNILVADYGPDAGAVSATRGPNGRVEWNILDEPGNYGWPYCVGNNTPYNDYNFASSTPGPAFNCGAIVNDSPNNTGLTNLPPAKAAVIWQSNNGSITGTPEIGASGAPMTSGTYSFDPDLESDRKWPAYFDRKAIWADWNNNRLFTVQMNQAGTSYTDINRFLPNLKMVRPHALQFGPDGALYMIEWGSGFNGNNTDSGVYRIDYVEGNRAPVARATADKTSGKAPLTVAFDGSASFDPDTGDATGVTYAWDFGDGTAGATTAKASHTYATAGNYTARLTVTDAGGRTGTTNIEVVVGNTAPTVELTLPLNGGFFEFGDYVKYEVKVTDPEDGTIDCNNVVVQPALGHDEHSHGYEQYRGCSGVVPVPGDTGHVGANIFGVITAAYTDKGAGTAKALTGVDGVVLHTKQKEAEFFDETGRVGTGGTGTAGVTAQTTTDAGGGQNVTGIETGDWFGWDVMNTTGITGVTMRVASTTAGATFAVRQGSPAGTTIGTVTVPNTGGAQTYQDVTAAFTGDAKTSQPLYFVATTGGANVNWVKFNGRGITDNTPPAATITASTTSGQAPLPVSFTSTVTDAENDVPVTYAWDFGDGATSTEANPSHTYTKAGTYGVSLKVTDARGAATTKTLEVRVTTATSTCFSGRSDDFLGTELDANRWNRNVRADQTLTVADGSLNIPLTATDIHQTTNTAPNIVLQDLPAGRFEVVTKVTLPAVRSYQQAGLILYGDDNNYTKLVYSGRSSTPNKANNVIQFASETNATATETNSANLGATFPDTVWLKLASTDGTTVTASYSADGATYQPVTATAAARPVPANAKVGMVALAGSGQTAGITAKFDYFTITPDDTATPCGGGNGCLENFDGSALPSGWEVVKPTGNVTVGGGNLTIPMAGTDLYQTTNTAGDLVLRDLPAGAFTVTTKVTAPIVRQYQQAGLVLYGNDDNYLKFVLQGRTTGVDAAGNIIQLAKEVNAVAAETNTSGLGATFGNTVWLRLTSTDGTAVTAEYSNDGATWTKMSAGYDLTGITKPRLGLTAFANNATAAGISAQFDSFELESASCDEPETCLTDQFAGNALGTGWSTTRPSGNLTVSGGSVKIPLEATDLYQTTNTARDLVLTDLPDGPFVATTKVTAPINRSYQSAGLLLYGDDDNYLKHVFQGRSEQPDAGSNIIQTARETAGAAVETNTNGLGADFPTTVWLRLASEDGDEVIGSYSTDGETWTQMSAGYDVSDIADPKIGLLAAANTTAGAGITASFDWFTLGGDASCEPGTEEPADTTAPTTTITIAAASATGWYTTRPSFTLAAADGTGSGIASTEYRIAGGSWTPYTGTAVAVTGEGERTVEFRSTDKAGNVETAKSQVVKVDTVLPTVAATQAGDGAKTLTLAGTDATSGIDKVEYQVGDATSWSTYSQPLVFSDAGTYTVRYRAVDKAGNTSATATATVVVEQTEEPGDTTDPEVGVTVLGSYEGTVLDQTSSGVGGSATLVSEADGEGYTTTATLELTGLLPDTSYESHLHVGTTCGGFEGHYRDDEDGAGTPPNELWPTNPGWTPESGDPRIKANADGTSYAEATVAWAPRIEGGILAIHREGAIIGCVDLDLTGPGTVVLDATDDVEVTSLTYTVDEGAETAYEGPFEITDAGTHTVAYTATDAAGNETSGSFEVVVPETEEPQALEVALTTTPAAPSGRGGWYTGPVTVDATATGGEGERTLEHRTGDGAWQPWTGPVRLTRDGTYRVQVRVTDGSGATKIATQVVRIDATAPRVVLDGIKDGATMRPAQQRRASVTTTDATSGIARRVVRLDGKVVGVPVRLDAVALKVGTHRMVVTTTDVAGNERVTTVTFRVVASYVGGKQLVKRLDRENKVGAGPASRMLQQLNAAQKADRRGEVRQARQALAQLDTLANRVGNKQAKAALKSLTRALRAQL
ncbi:ThuA domain-containing protein [Nocardioides litoris]|uniref:ThuA domain-containing protein n=1 Tax=Nocardioides litoris TaxID=1926648 RepID=UPI0011232366|nr:ThuA domain-containing protein [Nocardioides litoris]